MDAGTGKGTKDEVYFAALVGFPIGTVKPAIFTSLFQRHPPLGGINY